MTEHLLDAGSEQELRKHTVDGRVMTPCPGVGGHSLVAIPGRCTVQTRLPGAGCWAD